MRCVAGAGLVALVGCNQVFGIASTQGFDASNDVTIDMPHVELTWQVAQVIEAAPGASEPANLGDPDPLITFAPISPAPRVRIATLTGEFGEDAASYSASDGWILIPRSYLGITWRLEYTLADGVAREVQWAPEDKRGRLIVPMFGRLDRSAVPTGGGYTVTPPQLPAAYDKPRVLTTGLWTEGIIPVVPAPKTPPDRTIDYDFLPNSVSLSGAKGRPDHARGDRALLVDYSMDGNGCRLATGAADFPADLLVGTHSAVTPTWDTRSKTMLRPVIGFDVLTRLTDNLGSLIGGSIIVGHTANLEMPSLTETSLALPLPVPMMQILAQCAFSPPQLPPMPAILTPLALANFPIIEHIQLTEVRTLQDTMISVTSGLETVLTTVAGSGPLSFDVVFPAAFPTMIRIAPDGGPAIELVSGTQDHIPIGPIGPFTLSFTPEPPKMGSNIQSDYYEVVLHKIGSTALIAQRIYTVTVPSVRIDSSVLAPATEYVFEVRSYKGRPMAARGDFIPVEYPYGAAIVFTHSFKTP